MTKHSLSDGMHAGTLVNALAHVVSHAEIPVDTAMRAVRYVIGNAHPELFPDAEAMAECIAGHVRAETRVPLTDTRRLDAITELGRLMAEALFHRFGGDRAAFRLTLKQMVEPAVAASIHRWQRAQAAQAEDDHADGPAPGWQP